MTAARPNSPLRALVTGASTGIGRAFAEALARRGHDLIVVARDRPRLERLASDLRSDVAVEVLDADLTREAELARVERQLVESPGVDLLVNNAGFGTHGRFTELPLDREIDEIRLNVIAVVRLTRAALPQMVERGHGAVINVSSMASFQAAPYNATYGATKAYVTSFTEAISEELRGTGVRVQALCPGFTRTEFQERAGVDVGGLPDAAWMSAEDVVESSLAALDSGGVVHVPGAVNRVLAGAAGLVPRAILRWLGGRIGTIRDG